MSTGRHTLRNYSDLGYEGEMYMVVLNCDNVLHNVSFRFLTGCVLFRQFHNSRSLL